MQPTLSCLHPPALPCVSPPSPCSHPLLAVTRGETGRIFRVCEGVSTDGRIAERAEEGWWLGAGGFWIFFASIGGRLRRCKWMQRAHPSGIPPTSICLPRLPTLPLRVKAACRAPHDTTDRTMRQPKPHQPGDTYASEAQTQHGRSPPKGEPDHHPPPEARVSEGPHATLAEPARTGAGNAARAGFACVAPGPHRPFGRPVAEGERGEARACGVTWVRRGRGVGEMAAPPPVVVVCGV